MVAAVNRDKVRLFSLNVSTSVKRAAWERVRDSVNAVSKVCRATTGVRYRFYDCQASVNKKIGRHLLAQSTGGKAGVFRQWEAELRDGLLADEDVPGVNSKGPAKHQRADRATSSMEGSAPSSCPQYSDSESLSHIPDPPASASVRKQWHITPQHQQDQPEGRAQCSPPCSPVLICDGIELQNEPELTPVIPQTPAFHSPHDQRRRSSRAMFPASYHHQMLPLVCLYRSSHSCCLLPGCHWHLLLYPLAQQLSTTQSTQKFVGWQVTIEGCYRLSGG